MAFSYSWNDIISAATTSIKGRTLAAVGPLYCDMVSNDMYIEYPWRETVQTTETAPGMTPLLDGYQDVSSEASNVWRLLTASIWNTSSTPFDIWQLDVRNDLQTCLTPMAYTGIRVCSWQSTIGLIRLEYALRVPVGQILELHYTFQTNPDKITNLNQKLWFDDKYVGVCLEGLLYHSFKLNDDPRAGSAVTDAVGRATGYTGQLGIYKAALNRMKSAEAYGSTDQIFPGAVMGAGRDVDVLDIFG